MLSILIYLYLSLSTPINPYLSYYSILICLYLPLSLYMYLYLCRYHYLSLYALIYTLLSIYSVFFFMRTKLNANFTYLYLIEINDWCLIFSSMLGHLIIYKEIQILIIMWLVKLENLKLVGFQFCRVESKIYCYTKLSIWSHWGI